MSSVEYVVTVAIGGMAFAAPMLLFAGEPAGSLSREELVANDIDLTSYVRDLADETGTTVQSVRKMELPVTSGIGGDPEVVRHELEVEVHRLDRSEVQSFLVRVGKYEELVDLREFIVTQNRRGRFRLTARVATWRTSAEDASDLPQDLPETLGTPNPWTLLVGATAIMGDDMESLERAESDGELGSLRISGTTTDRENVEPMLSRLADHSCFSRVVPEGIDVRDDGPVRFRFEAAVDCERVQFQESTGELDNWKRSGADSPSEEATDSTGGQQDDAAAEVHVYSKPKGSIIVDGEKTGETTPGRVELKPGAHRIRVQFEGTKRKSAPKRVDLEKGEAPRLFFRKPSNNP